MPHALNSKPLRTNGIKDCRCQDHGGFAWLARSFADLLRIFHGSFADFRVKTLSLSGCFRKTCNPFIFEQARLLRGFPQSPQTILVYRDQGIPAISRGGHKKLRTSRLGDMRNLPAIGLQEGKCFDRTYGTKAYDASFAKFKLPFTNHLTLLNDAAITHLSRKSVILSRLLSRNFGESFKPAEMVAQV